MDRMHHWGTPLVGALTVAVAVWGAVTGTVAWRQNREINIAVTAATYAGINQVPNSKAIGADQLRVSIINTSARAVSVVQAEVLLDGAVVGRVVGVTQDAALGDERVASSAPVPLPVTVSADSSSKLVMDWRTAPTAQRLLSATLRLPIARRRFRLRVVLEPGGTRTEDVRSGDQPPLIGGWSAVIRLRDNRVTHIVMVAAARSTATTEGTLKLWRTDPRARRPVLTLRRPAGWALPAWFSVSSLASGNYVYTLSADDTVVGGGAVRTRCKASDATYVATACRTGDATTTSPFVTQLTPPG
jgi:hypothetical protein